MTRIAIVALALVACGGAHPAPAPVAAHPDVATVPLHVEGNRPFVDIAFARADGSTKIGRFLVDSGGGGFLFAEPFAKELGLELGETMHEEGAAFAQVKVPPKASIGSVALELNPQRVLVLVGRTSALPPAAPGHADGMLPGHVLAKYHVVFDYPKKAFTIAKPGALASTGTAIAMPVNPESGFPRTELVVDGTPHGMLLDTGASFTMVSEVLLGAWGTAHAAWERHPGAFGDAATLGGQTLETMFVPEATWGGNALARVGVTSQKKGAFEDWMSSMMAAPIEGSLAGNVLSQFRVDLDYPNQKLYLSR